MNERIEQLAEQCVTRKFYVDHASEEFDYKKFAELIVEEMYDFMCKATNNDGAWPSSKEVKQHFGVDSMSTEDKKTLIKELLGLNNV